ncbi:TPA: hypothetical protein ACIZAI_001027 [Legionella pneumophila]
MGRWLNMIENISETELTKPTEPGYVSFVGDTQANLIKKSREKILKNFVDDCCLGLGVKSSAVINYLISNEDEEDILNGLIPKSCLVLHIKLWIENGQPDYSGRVKKQGDIL